MQLRKVAITSTGAITPLGLDVESMWQAMLAGKSGIGEISAFDASSFPCRIAGQVPEFKLRDHLPKSYRKARKLMSRDIELSIIAADETFKKSVHKTKGIDPDNVNLDPVRSAVNFGAGLISCELDELAPAVAKSAENGKFDLHKWGASGMNDLTPIWLLKYLPNMPACHVGIIHDIQGPSNTITCGEVSGLLAVAEAAFVIERNDADLALAGGVEAKVNPVVMLRQALIKRAVTTSNDDPQRACRPFDAGAAGCVFGEAAAMVLLEELEKAKSSGSEIIAEIAGTGSSSSLNPDLSRIEQNARAVETAVRQAMQQAQIGPEKLGLIIPHGTAVPDDDRAEVQAIERILGPAVLDVPVLPTKSMISNTGAASGAVDLIIAAMAVREGKIPAAKNFETPIDHCRLNIPKEVIEKDIEYALVFGYSFGGQVAAVVIKNSKS